MSRGALDFVVDYAVPLPLMVIARLLGAPDRDIADFRRWSDGMLQLIDTLHGGEEAVRAANTYSDIEVEMRQYCNDLIRPRRLTAHDDLLGRLVHPHFVPEPPATTGDAVLRHQGCTRFRRLG